MNQNEMNRFGFEENTSNQNNSYNNQQPQYDTGENYQSNFNNGTGIPPINQQFNSLEQRRVQTNNRLVRRMMRPRNMGFGNVKFIVITIILSLIVGIGIGIMMMK